MLDSIYIGMSGLTAHSKGLQTISNNVANLNTPGFKTTTPADDLHVTIAFSRFCWECGGTRVMCAMQFGDVLAVKSRRLPRNPDASLELLALDFEPGEAPGGRVILMFAGGGDLRVDVECLDAVVADVSERWPAKIAPTHGEGDA